MPKGIPKNGINEGQFKKGNTGIWLGKKRSNADKKKMSDSHKGKPAHNKGKKGLGGDNHWNWQGGITPENKMIRQSIEYKLWREAVFQRDNYTCIWCSAKGYVEADHIKPFALFPELRFAIDNGRTLCLDCHRTTDTWGKRIINYGKE